MEPPRFHARATYRDRRDARTTVSLVVYSVGESVQAFELHISTQSKAVRGGVGEIISEWQRENRALSARGFLLEHKNIIDQDFEL